MSEPQHNPFQAQRRPDDAVTGVLPDRSALQAATDELDHIGMDVEHVQEYDGSEGLANFDLTGERHGRWAQLVRSWKNMGGQDANVLSRYNDALKQGHVLILLPMSKDRTRDEIVAILKRHGATDLQYSIAGSMETLL